MTPPTDKSILFLSYWYAPMQGMGVHRVLRTCDSYRKKGFQIYVLSSRNRRLVRQDQYPGHSVEAEEVHALDFRFWHAVFSKKTGERNPSSVKKKSWYSWFVRCSQSFPLDMVFGEGGFTYILNGVIRASRIIQDKRITHIHSSYGPMADHWIAAFLKYLHPDLHWIADFRDQHVDIYRANTFLPGWQRWVDRQLLRKADRVTTVSHGMASQLGYLNKPIRVIYNNHPVKHPVVEACKHEKKFKITYTGSIYPWQDLDKLCMAVNQLESEFPNHIELIYAGRDGDEWDARIKSRDLLKASWNEGLVSHKRALKLQKEADLNVLLTWNQKGSGGVLTGKLFEYIGSQRPLLVLINGEKDPEMKSILENAKITYHMHATGDPLTYLNAFIRKLFLYKNEMTEKPLKGVLT